jgi:hypothetical protein
LRHVDVGQRIPTEAVLKPNRTVWREKAGEWRGKSGL